MELERIRTEDAKQAEDVSMAVKRLEERMIAERSGDFKDFVLENNRKGVGGVE